MKLHLDPPKAHTVNIEPLTPSDWESERCRINSANTSNQSLTCNCQSLSYMLAS